MSSSEFMLDLIGDTYTSSIVKPFEIVSDVCTVISRCGFDKYLENVQKNQTLQSTINVLKEDCLQDVKPQNVPSESKPKKDIEKLVKDLKKQMQDQNTNNILELMKGFIALANDVYKGAFVTKAVSLQDKIPSSTFAFYGKLFTGISALAGIKKYSDAVKSIPAKDSYILQFMKFAHVITLAHSLVKLI